MLRTILLELFLPFRPFRKTANIGRTTISAQTFSVFVGIRFYPPKPHRSRGTEIDFWTPCDMLYQRKMPTMF